jgi:hypothetical protein
MKRVLVPLGTTHLVRRCSESDSHTSDCSTQGDGIMLSRFLHTLSQIYQGLSPTFAAPTFEKHHFPTPSHSAVTEFLRARMPPLRATDHEPAQAESRKNVEIVSWRIDNHDIEELRSALSSKRQNGPFLSKHACLVAYLVSVLNYNRSNPVEEVTSVISVSDSICWVLGILTCAQYRDIRTSFFAENVASNLVLNVRVFYLLLR